MHTRRWPAYLREPFITLAHAQSRCTCIHKRRASPQDLTQCLTPHDKNQYSLPTTVENMCDTPSMNYFPQIVRCDSHQPLPPLTARGKSPPDVFPRMNTSGFRGSCASGTSSLTCSRLFIHSLLTARGKSPSDFFPRIKTSGFRGSCAPGTSSLTCSRLFFHSLLR